MASYYPTSNPEPPPPSSNGVNPHGSLHQSSFHTLTLEHSLEDLSARFIVNLPAEELESMDRVCFQIEQAHWYYEDFIRPAALNPGLLPSYGLKAFSLLMFRSCPLLHDLLPNHNKIWNSFMAYKERVPVCGAIIISEYWDKVLLVKGWTKGSSWSFPRGKINKEEPEAMCAVREVLEETGFDMTDYFHPSQFQPGHVEDEGSERIPYYVELVIKEQKIRLYFIPGVSEDTVFETRTRKEISKIEWFKLNDLPTWSKDKKGRTTRTKAQLEGRQAKFYMVTPFISHLKLWIDHHKPKNLRIRPNNELSPPANNVSPLPSPNPRHREHPHSYGEHLHDDATYHLPSEIELGDSTSAEADSTEDELDDFLPQPHEQPEESVSFETTQQGTEALTAFFFGSPPPAPSNPLPLSPPSRSQSFEVASTPPHVAYERQSSFLQPKPQTAMSQQTKLLELLSGAVPSPPPPAPPASAPEQQQQRDYSSQYEPQQPRTTTTESRSLLHLLNDVNLSESPSTPQDNSTPQHSSSPMFLPSPSQQPHSILFSDSQAPPEARDFGQPLPSHLLPERNDQERKEKHNALLRALFSVATRPTPPQAQGQTIEDVEGPMTPTTMMTGPGNVGSYSGSSNGGWVAREQQQDRRTLVEGRDDGLGKNGEPYGPDGDDDLWPPPVVRRNQLYPIESPQLPEPTMDHFDPGQQHHTGPPSTTYPTLEQIESARHTLPRVEQPTYPAAKLNGGGSLLSILNGSGGERAIPPRAQAPSSSSPFSHNSTEIAAPPPPATEPRGKDPLELLREHRARQLGQDMPPVSLPPMPVAPPQVEPPRPAPVEPIHVLTPPSSHPPLPIPPQAPVALPPFQHKQLQQPQQFAQPQFPRAPYPAPPSQYYQPPPPQPFNFRPQPNHYPQASYPHPQYTHAPPLPPIQQPPHPSYSNPMPPLPPPRHTQPQFPPAPQPPHQFPPPQQPAISHQQPPAQVQPTVNLQSQNDFPPLPSAPVNANSGKGNAGALLGLLNAKG
ncbi:hypothetical protein JCM16303_006797 [Sporobolomyces ruberrimus]